MRLSSDRMLIVSSILISLSTGERNVHVRMAGIKLSSWVAATSFHSTRENNNEVGLTLASRGTSYVIVNVHIFIRSKWMTHSIDHFLSRTTVINDSYGRTEYSRQNLSRRR